MFNPLFTLSLVLPILAIRTHHSLPEDTYAFPKYRVSFLNALPLLNETAERWLRDGLRGGELEFIDQLWDEDPRNTPKEIDGGQHLFSTPEPSPLFKLEMMKLGSKMSYLCLVPPPPSAQDIISELDDDQADVTPVHSWSLLQPLSGSCLYHRQGWFTYSYCHNQKIRQFRELSHSHPHPPGGHVPEEDPEWESYTLGRAPPTPEQGADLTVAEQTALAANLELARGAGSRYLVQRWGDGTTCDKTGKKREVEVQFHCSMTMTDTILFVKEARTCAYVLVIHTPRLCSVPGFKSAHDERDEVLIRCREVVGPDQLNIESEEEDVQLPEADRPIKAPFFRKHVVAAANSPEVTGSVDAESGESNVRTTHEETLRRALQSLLDRASIRNGQGQAQEVVVKQDGEVLIGYVDLDLPVNADAANLLADLNVDMEDVELGGDVDETIMRSLVEALRAAGLDVKDGAINEEKEGKEQKRRGKGTSKGGE